MVDHILAFIDRRRDEPFFVYYPMILPHWPFEPTPDSPTWDPTRRASDRAEQRGQDPYEHERYFIDMVEYTDKMVGRIVDHLEGAGLRENTLVIFTADNGTERGIESKIDGKTLIGGKLLSTDAGTRVPLIANWPGLINPGQVNGDLICFTYFFPTLADATGVSVSANIDFDGQSFAPALFGAEADLRDWLYMWWFRNNDPDGPGDEFARTLRYKYYRDDRFYDLANDPMEENPIETRQLIGEQRDVRDRLREIIQENTRPGFYQDDTPP